MYAASYMASDCGPPRIAFITGARDSTQGTVTKLLPNPLGRKISEWAPTRLSSPVRKKRRMTGLSFQNIPSFLWLRPPKHSLAFTPLTPSPHHVAELSGDVSPPLILLNCSRNLVSRGRSAIGRGWNGGRRSERYVLRIETCRWHPTLPPNSPKLSQTPPNLCAVHFFKQVVTQSHRWDKRQPSWRTGDLVIRVYGHSSSRSPTDSWMQMGPGQIK